MQYVDPEVLAALMVQNGCRPGFMPSEELLCVAAVIVEHCAQIADLTEQRDRPMVKQTVAGAQIRAEWGLR
jgi:hypothetical protein